ncbi:uncharacterized protein LOC126285207 [Schistocerca gregaria]|uniref:uncharacterized protein LOC126285207 n=1 Tax=Schistocerca gregaria TaxID=7010 RepID=UPI00211EAA97|nr:uncharacterized protein LOC126285207 [Schistocerca gregaria]
MIGKNEIIANDTDNGRITEKEEILNHIKNFCDKLYERTHEPLGKPYADDDEIPKILPEETRKAINEMQNGKAGDHDDLTIDILKLTGEKTDKQLAKVFSLCIQNGSIPTCWNKANIILLHKKGSIHDLRNYHQLA